MLVAASGVVLCVSGCPYQERIEFYSYTTIHSGQTGRVPDVHEFAVSLNKARGIVMSFQTGYDLCANGCGIL